jgi:hypothetical protein
LRRDEGYLLSGFKKSPPPFKKWEVLGEALSPSPGAKGFMFMKKE